MTAARLSYQTIEFGDLDIHICALRDKQQFSDPEGIAESLGISSASWPLFGLVWPSGIVLAKYLFEQKITKGTRILEVGCGIGLSSLLLNKLGSDVTATDHHPEVQAYLNRNSRLNQDADIAFERVDWADEGDSLGLFDLIVGSDLLYEDQHIDLLAEFIAAHAKPECEVILVDPGRGRKTKISKKLQQFGFSAEQHKPVDTDYLEKEFKGHILTFVR